MPVSCRKRIPVSNTAVSRAQPVCSDRKVFCFHSMRNLSKAKTQLAHKGVNRSRHNTLPQTKAAAHRKVKQPQYNNKK